MTQSWDSYIVIKSMIRHILGNITVGVQHVGVKSPYTERSDSFMPYLLVELEKTEISMSF